MMEVSSTEEKPFSYVSPCSLCRHMATYGTHGSFEFCRKEFPASRGWEVPNVLSLGRRDIGCHLFESNGSPITKEMYEKIISPDYPIKRYYFKNNL